MYALFEVMNVDKEKIISALERCIGAHPCVGCPFEATLSGITNFPDCMASLQKEALKMIQELTETTVFKETLCEGIPFKNEDYDTSYTCTKCGGDSIGKSNYCKHCGRPVGSILETAIISEVEVNA